MDRLSIEIRAMSAANDIAVQVSESSKAFESGVSIDVVTTDGSVFYKISIRRQYGTERVYLMASDTSLERLTAYVDFILVNSL